MYAELSVRKRNMMSTTAVFAIFFIVLLIQHSFVYFYFDDYGYASLSFINNIQGVPGTQFSFAQFAEFYQMHYLNITGRIFAQALVTLTLASGIWCVRIVQCISIILILYLTCTTICRYTKASPVFVALTVCLLYGLLEIFMLDRSIYWFTASGTYMWPLAPLIFGCWTYYRFAFEGEQPSGLQKIFILLCLFFAATAQEQLAVAELFMIAAFVLVKLWKTKKISLFDLLAVACTIGGVCFILCSPSNIVRIAKLEMEPSYTEYVTMPIVRRVLYGIRIILSYVFSRNFYLFVMTLLACGAYVGWRMMKEKTGNIVLNSLLTILCIGSGTAMAATGDGLFTLLTRYGLSDKFAYLYICCLLLFLLYGVTLYFVNKKNGFMLAAFYAAGISVFCVVIAFIPSSARLYIPFVFLAFLPMGNILCDSFSALRTKRLKAVCAALLMLVVCFNMVSYTTQFYNTADMKAANDKLLREYSARIKNGEQIDVVDIRLYPNIESDTLNPYEGTKTIYREETIACIKEYYDLPPELFLNWLG